MKSERSLLIIGVLLICLSGCTYSLHSAHVSDFSPTFQSYQRGQVVEAKADQFTVMGFVSETNYVDQAFQELQGKCPGGVIQGVVTQHSTSHGFFSWTNHISMKGLCIAKK